MHNLLESPSGDCLVKLANMEGVAHRLSNAGTVVILLIRVDSIPLASRSSLFMKWLITAVLVVFLCSSAC